VLQSRRRGRGRLPLFTQLLLTIATGLAAALAARSDLRVSPKPAAFSRAFLAYLLFAGLVLVPYSVYFYLFHGDWYLLYLVDTGRVPSAVVLVGCLLEIALGAGGFLLGASLIRTQRDPWLGASIGATVALGLAVIPVARPRLSVVGSYAQYQGDFGLAAYGGALLQGTLWMSLWLVLGLGYLLYRLGPGARRA
jgi:hypothetical protein